MMAWHDAGHLRKLEQLGRQVVEISGQKILLIWHDNEVYAVQSQCPHLKLPLAKASINKKNELVCPFHKSAFDLSTGDVKCWAPSPALLSGILSKISKPKNLIIYAVKLEDNQILVNL
jgi:nitrite reductase/ring-hydroxylating ferredoxin subunit